LPEYHNGDADVPRIRNKDGLIETVAYQMLPPMC
jgi:hypothetical protein